MKFKYFKKEKNKVKDINKTQNALSIGGNSVIVDVSYLPIIESAEEGDILATAELAEAFRGGREGLVKNYKLAKYYADIMLEDAKGDIILEVEAYHNSGFLEHSFGNYKKAIRHYKKAIFLMHHHLPTDKWRTGLYVDMWESVKALRAKKT